MALKKLYQYFVLKIFQDFTFSCMFCFQIRVNSVLPTDVSTEMFRKYVEEIKGTAVEAELKDSLG